MDILWNRYMVDGRFRLYEHGLINELADKYDEQLKDPSKKKVLQHYYAEEDAFLKPEKSREFLMRGNSAIITIWDSVREEVPNSLIMSCQIDTILDDHVQLYYGYSTTSYSIHLILTITGCAQLLGKTMVLTCMYNF